MDDTYPEVVISGRLALDLLEVLEWATLRTHEGEDVVRTQFEQMTRALGHEVRDAAPPMEWVQGAGMEGLPDSLASRDEVRSLPYVMGTDWPNPPRDLSPYIEAHEEAVRQLAKGLE